MYLIIYTNCLFLIWIEQYTRNKPERRVQIPNNRPVKAVTEI